MLDVDETFKIYVYASTIFSNDEHITSHVSTLHASLHSELILLHSHAFKVT